ncbi:hypothetical protein KUA02_11080 [Komagataeibacter pomaceti]|uniref:Uncharacterized protein n=2 Tax=Novacetimonas pomaceti TaxID=2021998 RepID=A0ABX5P5W1_9PROT|nr:hypothetical protein [Novacetimonas pomaceti]PYD47308.1 hypothetical protein C3920_10605 [Novacetimonas pomaceti]
MAAPAPATAQPPEAPSSYAISDFAGPWSSLGIEPLTITAQNKETGAAARLGLKLSPPLEKVTGLAGRTIVLKQENGTTLTSLDDNPQTTFTLVSQNSAVLKMKGKKPGQVLNLPLSRAD